MPGPNRRRPWKAALAALAAVCLPPAASCVGGAPSPTGGSGGGEDMPEVLFVGNSLTAANDLPSMMAALAEADGADFPYAVQAISGFGLGDHWDTGLADAIARLSPDVVVLQQGPSSLPSSREYLLEWTDRIADVVSANGGRSALFMVWPEAERAGAFDDVRAHYAEAATLVEGIFIPAGETWRAAWTREPALPLYAPDGFHPSRTGSAAAAITIWAMLRGGPGEPLPCRAETLVDAATAELLCEAMREAVGAYGIW